MESQNIPDMHSCWTEFQDSEFHIVQKLHSITETAFSEVLYTILCFFVAIHTQCVQITSNEMIDVEKKPKQIRLMLDEQKYYISIPLYDNKCRIVKY